MTFVSASKPVTESLAINIDTQKKKKNKHSRRATFADIEQMERDVETKKMREI